MPAKAEREALKVTVRRLVSEKPQVKIKKLKRRARREFPAWTDQDFDLRFQQQLDHDKQLHVDGDRVSINPEAPPSATKQPPPSSPAPEKAAATPKTSPAKRSPALTPADKKAKAPTAAQKAKAPAAAPAGAAAKPAAAAGRGRGRGKVPGTTTSVPAIALPDGFPVVPPNVKLDDSAMFEQVQRGMLATTSCVAQLQQAFSASKGRGKSAVQEQQRAYLTMSLLYSSWASTLAVSAGLLGGHATPKPRAPRTKKEPAAPAAKKDAQMADAESDSDASSSAGSWS